jgi:DNA-binding transcriptional MocR family regulator
MVVVEGNIVMDTIWQPSIEDRAGPKYSAVVEVIRAAIADGTLAVGARLPPVRDLAWQLSITPGTVARAYTILTDEGALEATVGRGTFVPPPKAALLEDVWSRQAPLQEDADQGPINLFSPHLVDMGQVAHLRQAMAQVASSDARIFMHYPTRTDYGPVRAAVLSWLSDLPLGPLDQNDVVLANGGQNAICLVMQAVLTGPRPVVLMEDISYAGFRRAAELMRADVTGVAMDACGMCPDALEAATKSGHAQLICLTPDVQNPTGRFMPLERRKDILAIAERHDLQILEDDCYRMGAARAASFRALAPARTWHVSSISKALTPALRVGFALAPEGRRADLRRAAEYGFFGLSQPLAELTRIVLSDPATKDIASAIRHRMADYIRVAVNVLGRFDINWDAEVPFLWLTLPAGWRSAAFCRAAEAQGVQIRSADEFCLRNGRAPHAVRLAVNGQVSLSAFEAAMQRLQSLLDNPPEQISV